MSNATLTHFYEPPYFDLFEVARVQMNKKTHHCAILMLSQTLMLMCLVRGFTAQSFGRFWLPWMELGEPIYLSPWPA